MFFLISPGEEPKRKSTFFPNSLQEPLLLSMVAAFSFLYIDECFSFYSSTFVFPVHVKSGHV